MKPTRLMSPPGTYFVTTTTFQRRRFFIVESYARLFLKTLYRYRRQGRFQLHAFVLMPDHVHLLITPARDVTIERAMQIIKGGYSHAVGQEISRREIWQKGFTDHRIRDAADYEGHRVYIHRRASRVYPSQSGGSKTRSRPVRVSLLLRVPGISARSVAPSG
jgi:putative transposase